MTCAVGSLAPGASIDVHVVARIDAAGSLTDVATVLAAEVDTNPVDNEARALVTGSADLLPPPTGSNQDGVVRWTLLVLGVGGLALVAGRRRCRS